ncbi:hypothetical protein K488DRAFT_84207 [Vararia minispora EC-137]|uniref:Uncharacterized protein n=1 Tax=Vararia minispora EC-137 TaxID=1314806 RepID=A0ACB8QRC0_9AGAM|nr:hypothetical protein K488DRAFT_84207 [Vararia minispora EC-137]
MAVHREPSLTSDPERSYTSPVLPTLPLAPSRQLPRERPFKSPYVYNNAMRDYAYWDNLFYERLVNGLTLHEFKKPPKAVLAVGEGTDLWVVSAAQQWPNTCFHCIDFSTSMGRFGRVLPSLNTLGQVTFESITSLLEPLPYPDDYFDLIILRYMTLHSSERDWPIMFSNLMRVCKPEGVMEAVADDLSFPGTSTSNAISPTSPLEFAVSLSPRSDFLQARSRYDSSESYFSPTLPSPVDEDHIENPLDHSRLAEAWEEMLAARGIPIAATSVAAFYMSTASPNFRLLPPILIRMPNPAPSPSSERATEDRTAVEGYARKLHLRRYPVKRNGTSKSKSSDRSSDADTKSMGSGGGCGQGGGLIQPISSFAPMHLARMVQTVRCCKEAIWEAYEVLFGDNEDSAAYRAMKVAQGDMVATKERHGTREKFEHDWQNWETDMEARIGMRDIASSILTWPEPMTDEPAWRLWRKRLWIRDPSNPELMHSTVSCDEVCRTMRAFVLYKGKD